MVNGVKVISEIDKKIWPNRPHRGHLYMRPRWGR